MRRHSLNIILDIMKHCQGNEIGSSISRVCNLSWYEAHKYLNKLTSLKILEESTSNHGYRGSGISHKSWQLTEYGKEIMNRLEEFLVLFDIEKESPP